MVNTDIAESPPKLVMVEISTLKEGELIYFKGHHILALEDARTTSVLRKLQEVQFRGLSEKGKPFLCRLIPGDLVELVYSPYRYNDNK